MRVAAVTVGQPDGILGRRHQEISVVAVPCSLWNHVLAPGGLVDGTAQRVGMVQHLLQVRLDGGAVGEEMLGGCVAVELGAAEGRGLQGPGPGPRMVWRRADAAQHQLAVAEPPAQLSVGGGQGSRVEELPCLHEGVAEPGRIGRRVP
jgi:hypothetical protein